MEEAYTLEEAAALKKAVDNGDPEAEAFARQRHHARMAKSYQLRAADLKGAERKEAAAHFKYHSSKVKDSITFIKKLREDTHMDQIDELSKKTLKSYTHKANQDRTKSFGDEKRYDKRLAGADAAVKKIQEEEIEETVLDMSQRMKRAAAMRRYENKLKRSKEMAQRHLAPEKNIKKRAMSAARGLLRKRVAGQRGAEYAQMGPSEKMAIDRLIDGKTKVVKKIALRLIPKIRQKEHMRLASFMKGAALENQGTTTPKTPTMESVDGKVNKKFADKFAVGATEKKEVKLYPKEDIKSVVKFHNKFSEEATIRSDTFKGLCKKAEKSGIDIDILGEVYDRGMDAWVESMSVSQQQYAFARVNSFINQGKSYFNEDADLQEAAEYRIRETNPGGLHTRHSVQRVKKGSNQPVGQATIYDKRADAENHVEKSGGRLREDTISEAKPNSQYQEWPGQGPKRAFVGQFGYQDNSGGRIAAAKKKEAAGEFDAKLDSRGRYTKDSVRKMFGGKLSPDAEGIKEEALNEANRLKYDASGKQWYHSANGGFTWKRVTSDEAKKAYPGKHKDITAEHDLKEETINEMSWTKQVQYADAAKKDRLDKFNQSLQTKDPVARAALLKRVENRGKTIQKVMDRSGWNKKPVKEEVFTSDKQPVIIPGIRNDDGTSQPAKTVMRRVRKKILGTGNVHDGR